MTGRMERGRLLGLSLRNGWTTFSLASAVVLTPMIAGCGGSKPAAPPVVEKTIDGTGTITGKVTLEGTPKEEEKPLPLDQACTASVEEHKLETPRLTRNYVVKDGALADVLVTLEGVAPQPIPEGAGPLTITQRGCEYSPYVAACQVGQTIQVVNDDPLTHNVHTQPKAKGNKEVNQSQAAKAAPVDFVYDKPEEFLRFKCDVHPWMFSYVSVLNHPFYAVTGEDGTFEIKGLPDGKYKVKFEHRKAGKSVQEVEVKDGKATVDVALKVAES